MIWSDSRYPRRGMIRFRTAAISALVLLPCVGITTPLPAQLPDGPRSVTATETAEGEITLTWTEVPGATAYYIGRAVQPGGFQALCQRCPPTTTYVDRNVTNGAKHTYTIAALLPRGASRRANSNPVVPGSVEAGGQTGSPGDVPGAGPGSGSATARPAAPKTPKNLRASMESTGSVLVTWDAPADQVESVAYWISRSVDGAAAQLVGNVSGSGQARLAFRDTGFPKPGEGGAGSEVRLAYHVHAINTTGQSPTIVSAPLVVRAEPGSGSTSTGSPAASCILEYRRADNGWAAEGRPDGFLGVETLTLRTGERKVLITDWKYEKERNDGTNYYGTHLRLATNRGKRPVQLRLKGINEVFFKRHGAVAVPRAVLKWNEGYVATFAPGDEATLRHDLMEVTCPS